MLIILKSGYDIYIGSYMSAHVLLNALRKRDKMCGFHLFNKFNNHLNVDL